MVLTRLQMVCRLLYMRTTTKGANMNETLNPASIVAMQFDEDVYMMLRRAGVSEARIDEMRATAAKK